MRLSVIFAMEVRAMATVRRMTKRELREEKKREQHKSPTFFVDRVFFIFFVLMVLVIVGSCLFVYLLKGG
jgi:cell division protein FtsL